MNWISLRHGITIETVASGAGALVRSGATGATRSIAITHRWLRVAPWQRARSAHPRARDTSAVRGSVPPAARRPETRRPAARAPGTPAGGGAATGHGTRSLVP